MLLSEWSGHTSLGWNLERLCFDVIELMLEIDCLLACPGVRFDGKERNIVKAIQTSIFRHKIQDVSLLKCESLALVDYCSPSQYDHLDKSLIWSCGYCQIIHDKVQSCEWNWVE